MATKKAAKLRLALVGPAGSGKTYSALAIATGLGSKIALIDTEHGSAALYADKFAFDTCNLETFSPDSYVEAIKGAEAEGYDVIIIDSLSHAWIGKDGALEQVDQATRRSGSKNSYFAWRDVTPKHRNDRVGSWCPTRSFPCCSISSDPSAYRSNSSRWRLKPSYPASISATARC